MGIGEDFQELLSNLQVDNAATISLRYGEITSVLNRKFRNTESKTANSLQIGSYGRWTAIKGVSDLDMIYIMPASKWSDYKDGGQYKLLKDTKDAISARYPNTTVKVDRLVVCVIYKDFHIEVQPAFEQADRSFKYPDTANGGSWKITKPREEIEELAAANERKNRNLRRLCKMARAWKNKHGVAMGGLLIDTLAYNFLESTDYFDDRSYYYYDYMSRDFFEYLSNEKDHEFYAAVGSRQRVRVKKKFQKKAKATYDLCVKAIDASGQKNERQKWRDVYGNAFPAPVKLEKQAFTYVFRDTEEFIEDRFPVDIRYDLKVDCKVTQNGFRTNHLLEMLSKHIPLLRNKKLQFFMDASDVPPDCSFYWKVLNQGDEAERRDQIRGQIVPDDGTRSKQERTSFAGSHIVECYAVQRGVVVARGKIRVPISWQEAEAA
ncbi:SMODS domain-containing nucleotidyltransferase [Phaeobacter gallaeciensis]|uniref:SMODS domain-containing nucleotidyltransferase n=1 Tax=Phaeobacter gallaeciensis TaxID=60890 RepID=UPI00237F3ADB|nr:nucleotidyltransferase [Phaeobacter gallaeciensis]MDE4063830.1 nucleotidyltransferase [Phaeobacter gallaeciensis]MDE4126857.1 nucleotidyltransferase [Phaeobacter gallaeciensis]MDE4131325.1 nucleotidyltransferase [Phaeobacter gallaeciensis]